MRHLHLPALLPALAATVVFFDPATPQTNPGRPENAVIIHVSARTASGPVADLTRERFHVLDDGEAVDISYFSRERQPILAALMLETSDTNRPALSRLRDAAHALISVLDPDDRLQIGSFGEELAINPLLTGDKSVLRRIARDELWSGGGAPLWSAIDLAMSALARQKGGRTIIVVTEGSDACRLAVCAAFDEVLDRAVRERFQIHVVGIRGTYAGSNAIQLAEDTGGAYVEPWTSRNLAAALTSIAEELRSQYVLGFVPKRLDRRIHPLRVRVDDDQITLRAPRRYLAELSR